MSQSAAKEQPLPLLLLLRYLAEAAVFFLFIGLFRVLGLDAASALGGFIGRQIFYRIPLMDRARQNLRAAFPDRADTEIESIVREMCDNLGRTVAEYAHLDKLSIHGKDPRIVIDNVDVSDAEMARGKGVIFISGHFANWEVLAFVATQLGYEGGAVYRPQNNPFVDRWLVKQRQTSGPKEQISKGAQGTRRIFSLLRRGNAIYLLVDQKTNEGVPALFFSREAMTTPAPASLALKLGVTLLPVSNERLKGSRFRMTVHEPVQFTPTGDHDRDVLALTQEMNRAIEAAVQRRPSQWLWIHRRWPTAREQDHARGKRALLPTPRLPRTPQPISTPEPRITSPGAGDQSLGGAGVAVEREGSSFT